MKYAPILRWLGGVHLGGMMAMAITAGAYAAPTQSVWCSISDPSSEQLFISNPYPLPMTSRMAVYAYGGRFARTVNLRFGMHVVLEGAYCHAFPSPHRAAAAHADLIAHMAERNFRIVSVGIF
ncbi:hypothetical protein GL297_08340 [Komagataeibacter sp. FXV2]|nr:hypothetical protein [Komagataeibacter sp. FXV2]